METTRISASKTAAEIEDMLRLAGARTIAKQYGPAGDITGMTFSLLIGNAEVPFALPVRSSLLVERLRENKYGKRNPALSVMQGLREQAERVAWRQMLRWIEAQLAMIDTRMVTASEVFLPYAWDGRKTFHQAISEGGYRALLGDGK